eukprot:scaffold80805_cov20-Prasinocladus_malaysianus.AAC.1
MANATSPGCLHFTRCDMLVSPGDFTTLSGGGRHSYLTNIRRPTKARLHNREEKYGWNVEVNQGQQAGLAVPAFIPSQHKGAQCTYG